MALSQVTPSLFLSGADAPLNGALMSQKGITLIVNATLSHALPAHPGVECLRVPVSDLPCERLGLHFDRVAERIHDNRAGCTLVHCVAGRSRSPALVMAYLMRFRGATLRQAHRRVLESRPCIRINAGFWEQLLQYERRLYGRNTVRVEPEGPQGPHRATAPMSSQLTSIPRSPVMSRSQVMMSPHKLIRESTVSSKSNRTIYKLL
ncbi:dual specificity protein phosphatase 18 [Gambusia affinis]|uniref:dual specificity protein phosphatase 18 n=1 Tax=Gambusia affinis TaxID=33528 RepID=UPI001CDC4067|nr:dual specificity protein phosphatase 18 [Gambusia affinis]